MSHLSALPADDPIAVPSNRSNETAKKLGKLLMGFEWQRYLTEILLQLEAAPVRGCDPVNLATQAASIAATTLPIGDVEPGIYRANYTARVTRAATTSSALTVTLAWTDRGVAQSAIVSYLDQNLTTQPEWGAVIMRVDADSAVTYATTYVSVGATPMQYSLDIVVEKLGADQT